MIFTVVEIVISGLIIMDKLTAMWKALIGIPLFDDWGSILGTAVLLVTFFNIVKVKLYFRKFKAFWCPFGKEWLIIKPKYDNSMARVEDVLAAHEIRTTLNSCGYCHQDTFDDNDISDADNIILLCGPMANKASLEFVRKYNLAFAIEWDEEKNIPFIMDNITGNRIYSPIDINGTNNKSDIGIVGRISTASNSTSRIFIFGIHGIATYGCAKFIASRGFIKECYPKLRNTDFIFLVRVDFKKIDEVTNTTVITKIYTGCEVLAGS